MKHVEMPYVNALHPYSCLYTRAGSIGTKLFINQTSYFCILTTKFTHFTLTLWQLFNPDLVP